MYRFSGLMGYFAAGAMTFDLGRTLEHHVGLSFTHSEEVRILISVHRVSVSRAHAACVFTIASAASFGLGFGGANGGNLARFLTNQSQEKCC